MLNLAGLSAAYPGFQAAEDTTARTQLNQTAAREAAIKLLGAHALGAALASAAQPGPQAPPPGQASTPAPRPTAPVALPPQAPTAPPTVAPPPPVVSAPAPAAPSPPAAQSQATAGGLSEVTLPVLTQHIVRANPGIVNHPEVFLAAVERAAPLLDRQGKEDIAEMRKQFTEQRLTLARERLKAAQEHWDTVSKDKNAQQTHINERLQERQGAAEDRFGRLHPNAPAVGAPAPEAPPPAPPAALLKPNTVTTFANGQKWTLGPDGQPKQVQ
jgi:hypothetical protein